MSGFSTISAILRGKWLIDKDWANTHLPLVKALIKGENENIFNSAYPHLEANNNVVANDLGSESGMQTHINERLLRFPMAGNVAVGMFTAGRYNSFNDAPSNSVAIIPISGPIMKNGGDCGEPGASHFTNWIKAANQSDRITGILLVIDSPGGMVDGTQTVVDAIKNSDKPVVAFVNDGMMASAATWIGTAADEVYASQKTDTIGSIGVYCTIYDFREYLKAEGITQHDIYAKQSVDKNKAYHDALDGNYAGMQDELNFIADQFIKGVKANRKGKLNLADNNPFTGKMFDAQTAMDMGLIDGFKNIEGACQRVYELAQTEQKFYA